MVKAAHEAAVRPSPTVRRSLAFDLVMGRVSSKAVRRELSRFAFAMGPSARLVLASASPRRRELLSLLGIDPVVRAVDVDESKRPGESAVMYLERVVALKLDAARPLVSEGELVLVADTVVVLDEAILGKPGSDEEAYDMVSSLAGREHAVMTRFAVERRGPNAASAVDTVTTRVEVRALTSAWIRRYVASGEGRDKAGAYAIQGHFGAAVRGIVGSYTNVVGLPLCEVAEVLERCFVTDGSGRGSSP
jgi:septum formation protein